MAMVVVVAQVVKWSLLTLKINGLNPISYHSISQLICLDESKIMETFEVLVDE